MEYAECATECQTMGAGHTRWYHTGNLYRRSSTSGDIFGDEFDTKINLISGCCECLDPRISRLNRNPQPMCKKCSMDSEPFFQDL